jgi:hypothetical protein
MWRVLLLMLLCAGALPTVHANVLIPMSSTGWKYLDTGVSQDSTSWKSLVFDDASWATGKAPLGFGLTVDTVRSFDDATVQTSSLTCAADFLPHLRSPAVSPHLPARLLLRDGGVALRRSGGVMLRHAHMAAAGAVQTISAGSPTRVATYYFRKTVNLALPVSTSVTGAIAAQCDDGIVLYINGAEVGRFNMPSGTITYSTLASSTLSTTTMSTTRRDFVIAANVLVPGDNVISAEVHQSALSSTGAFHPCLCDH